jgi:hypothetical protein
MRAASARRNKWSQPCRPRTRLAPNLAMGPSGAGRIAHQPAGRGEFPGHEDRRYREGPIVATADFSLQLLKNVSPRLTPYLSADHKSEPALARPAITSVAEVNSIANPSITSPGVLRNCRSTRFVGM